MQGNYNIAHRRGWVNIPHGDILLFGGACAQIVRPPFNFSSSAEGTRTDVLLACMRSPLRFRTPADSRFQMAPEALPPGYRRFVTGASRVAEPCLPVNLSATRHGYFDPAEARKALLWKGGATPHNAALIEQYAAAADKGDFGTPFAPCAVVHPWVDTCTWTAVDRWQSVFR